MDEKKPVNESVLFWDAYNLLQIIYLFKQK